MGEKINSVFERCNLDEVMNNLKALYTPFDFRGNEPESGLLDEMGESVFESGSYGKAANMVMYLANEDGSRHILRSAQSESCYLSSVTEMRTRRQDS